MAFYATVTDGQYGDVQPGHILIFEDVLHNDGDAYNSKDGIFKAPVSGKYEFYASIMACRGKEVNAKFLRNGDQRLEEICAKTTDNRHDQGSQKITLEMKKGRNDGENAQLQAEYESVVACG